METAGAKIANPNPRIGVCASNDRLSQRPVLILGYILKQLPMTSDSHSDSESNTNSNSDHGLYFDFEGFARQGDPEDPPKPDCAADRADIPAPLGTGPLPRTKTRQLDNGSIAIIGPSSLASWISSAKVVDLDDAR